MVTRMKRGPRRLSVAVAALALLAAGCADSDGGAGEEGSIAASEFGELKDGMVNITPASGEPVDGGTVEFAAYSEPRSLDPAKTIAAITTGGAEMLNIYDSLMRYDAAADEIVPQMAEGLEHNEDYTRWTLTLRDGVAFSDGSPVDAAAVKASQKRYSAASAPEAAIWNANVVDIATPDDATVVYTLDKTWPEFSFLLTSGPGMIVAPSAGPVGDGFTPIGAGPFTLDDWNQGNSLKLAARPDYWDGAPHLDSVEFVYMPTMQVSMETMFNGGVDMVFVREPDDVNALLQRDTPGYVNMTAASNAALINAAPGRAGADPRVRKAMQLAIDPAVLSRRAYGDPAFGESTLFPAYSRWNTDVVAPQTDPEKARELVAAAKADGFDGEIVSINAPDQARQQQAMAIEAQLEAVGFDVDTKIMPTIGDQIRVIASEQDYDLGAWGMSLREPDPFPKMFEILHSDGKQTYGMHTGPEMDALIEQFQVATDHDDQMRIMADIQKQVNEDVPFLTFGYYAEYVGWQTNVHGIEGTSNSMVSFADAWKS